MDTIRRENLRYMIGGTDEYGIAIDASTTLATNLISDLISFGFEEVAKDGPSLAESKKVILRPSITVDPNWTSDPWHIYFEVKGNAVIKNPLNPSANLTVSDRGLYMRVGSPTQLPSIAGISTTIPEYPLIPSRFNTITSEQIALAGGEITADYPRLGPSTAMTYHLTVDTRGFALVASHFLFTEDLTKTTVLAIQRGVGCDGTVSVDPESQKPLYIVTNVSATGSSLVTGTSNGWQVEGPRNAWFYNVIRETDTTAPLPTWAGMTGQGAPKISDGTVGSQNTSNNYPLNYIPTVISDPRELLGQTLNYFPTRWRTPVTNDSGEYILMFPFGLCTDRFAFSEEIDLIAVSKADAYQSTQEVPIAVYGKDRTYTALTSNNQNIVNDSGIRVFLLTADRGDIGG